MSIAVKVTPIYNRTLNVQCIMTEYVLAESDDHHGRPKEGKADFPPLEFKKRRHMKDMMPSYKIH